MKPLPDSVPNRHYVGLDVLRFVAAALVMGFHLAYWSWVPEMSTPKLISGAPYRFDETNSLTWFGWVGVEIFFVISGFVIVFSAGSSAWKFARSRFLRLVPAAWICATVGFGILIGGGFYTVPHNIGRLVRTLSFWPFAPWVDGVYWTLGIEISFYTVIFLLIAANLKHMLNLTLSLIGLLSSAYWVYQFNLMIKAGDGELPALFDTMPAGDRILELLLLKHGCFFAIGGLLWSLLCAGAPRAFWGVVLICIGTGCFEIYSTGIGHSQMDGQGHSILVPIVFWFASLLFVVASVVWKEKIYDILPVRLARTVGLATYPLYLLHDVAGAALLRLFASIGLNRWLALILALSLAIAASIWIADRLEPILRRKFALLLDWGVARRAPGRT
jgi:peptidoglycan/LPS O-acetylase OafA/YrhL